MTFARTALFGALMVGLMACAGPVPPQTPQKPAPDTQQKKPTVQSEKPLLLAVSFPNLPRWGEDRLADSLVALRRSCAVFGKQSAQKKVGTYGIGGRAGDWKDLCTVAFSLPDQDEGAIKQFYEQYFQPYLVTDPQKQQPAQGLFTGYYEAALKGSYQKGGPYQVPLYKRPDDLVLIQLGAFKKEWRGKRLAGKLAKGRLSPYASRTQIEQGALAGKKLELIWVDDAVDAFFLHIQGSGRVLLEDGSDVRVGYDGHNGHDYTSIGRILIDRGEISREKMSMQAIRSWLTANPTEAQALMRENESYIFFRPLTGPGPIGAQGVALTAGRSLAVDKRYIPYGMPLWLYAFTDPVDQKPQARMMVAQDTGGAIKGIIRGDVFWGFGEEAALRAGQMKETGSYFLMLPKATVAQCQVCEALR